MPKRVACGYTNVYPINALVQVFPVNALEPKAPPDWPGKPKAGDEARYFGKS